MLSKPKNMTVLQSIRHKIRVKLYPNTLPTVEGKYIARTNNQKAMSVEEVCQTLKVRSTYEGDYNSTVKAVKAYLDEVAYQLCDGFSVNAIYFSIHPNIGGTFNSLRDIYNREKNLITFRYRTLSQLSGLTNSIDVEIEGLANVSGYIDEFFDGESKSINDAIAGNELFSITGEKIKVVDDGNHPECGIYFVDIKEPFPRFKVQRHLIENTAHKINGLTPMLMGPASYRIEIVTQFSGNTTNFLKEPRTITSDFVLTIK